ncbi:unnamed protein product [Urochloa decumbens]|uniref:Uncharacterized protein n=1 Tax=Urochloa decumbens TaxID=240449 RepID=A0ABC9ALL6_9POAL
MPAPLGRRQAGDHRLRVRRVLAARQGGPGGHGARPVPGPAAHPRQQRRPVRLQTGCGHDAGRLRWPDGHQPGVVLRPDPPGPPAPPASIRRRRGGAHVLRGRLHRVPGAFGLLREQGRAAPAHPEPRRGVGAARCARQLRGAGSHRQHRHVQRHAARRRQGAAARRHGDGAGAHGPLRHAAGGGRARGLPLHARRLLHNWPGHLHRRRPHPRRQTLTAVLSFMQNTYNTIAR